MLWFYLLLQIRVESPLPPWFRGWERVEKKKMAGLEVG
jgi:hypothetical protein